MDANSRANLSKTDRIGHLLKLIEEDLDSVNFQMRRTRMKEHISQLRAILFPIENLPDELLLEIFTHYRDLNPVSIPYKARVAGEVVATMNSVLNISWVCTRWRQLAIRCSPLWSDFGVALEGKTIGEWEGNIDFHKELVDLFLARSGKHPLSLRLSVETFGITLPEHPTLVMLSRHSTRWRAVRFLELDFNNVFPTLATLELPVLKLLEMLGDDFNLVNCVLANAPLVDTFETQFTCPPSG
ncbi:hypothetical protein BT96DRAFT_179684 [Gymnopus androsaceus JB14]|uniref:Uncharacterized protein n=1 Tax=Gymnopus androsaceus JB14 TaxID=1447944 RepID=A0A6A4H9B3_9AGAR|nr:hypothetical protein BT96DRAFT_179684 [Gymnopus androsaceus JB14]